jgi:hypothetical protein
MRQSLELSPGRMVRTRGTVLRGLAGGEQNGGGAMEEVEEVEEVERGGGAAGGGLVRGQVLARAECLKSGNPLDHSEIPI